MQWYKHVPAPANDYGVRVALKLTLVPLSQLLPHLESASRNGGFSYFQYPRRGSTLPRYPSLTLACDSTGQSEESYNAEDTRTLATSMCRTMLAAAANRTVLIGVFPFGLCYLLCR